MGFPNDAILGIPCLIGQGNRLTGEARMIRRYGEPIKAGQVYRRRAGVYGVLLEGDAVLLTHQAAPVPEFQLPGGGIDPGENPIAALHREVYEETGWHIGPVRHVGSFRRFTYMPEYDRWAEKVCAVFVARPTLRMGPPTEAGHRAIWLQRDKALAVLDNEGDHAMLRRALRQVGPR
jgi:8-oxo-dGTP diphosphatase